MDNIFFLRTLLEVKCGLTGRLLSLSPCPESALASDESEVIFGLDCFITVDCSLVLLLLVVLLVVPPTFLSAFLTDVNRLEFGWPAFAGLTRFKSVMAEGLT